MIQSSGSQPPPKPVVERCPENLRSLTGSMCGVRVGEEEPHSVVPQDCLLFTLTRVTPTLKEIVFPDFFESEQDPDYSGGLTEEPRESGTPLSPVLNY
jgi:hypothetical protein